MRKRFFVQAECGQCRRETSFRLLGERDALRRPLMVCSACGRRQPRQDEQGQDGQGQDGQGPGPGRS